MFSFYRLQDKDADLFGLSKQLKKIERDAEAFEARL